MAVGSGLGAQVGVAAESTYGTYVAPTKFLEVEKANLTKVKNTAQGMGFAASRLLPSASRRVVTTKAGKGTLELDVASNGMGLLLQALMGTTVTPVQQGATTAYLQTHTLADSFGKALSVQLGVPQTDGTVKAYSYLGCRVAAAEFDFEVDKTVGAKFDLDARDVDESKALAAASFPTGVRPFVGTDTSVKVGTYGSEAAVTGVTKASVKVARSMKTDQFYFGASGLKAQPVTNDFVGITGTITSDFVDKTIWADRFTADTGFSLVLEAVGPTISGAYAQTFRITLPGCYLDGDTPNVDGLDVVSGAFPFVCLFDGTNLPKIEYISTDTAL